MDSKVLRKVSIRPRQVVHIIVNRGYGLWRPVNIKGANKNAKIYVGRSTTVHNLLFCVHKLTVCMNYVTNTFLLISSSVQSKQLLCFVHCQGQKREQKHTAKNFIEFHNHSPLLTMSILPEHIPVFVSWMRCQSIAGLPPALKFSATHLYTWVERSIARVLVQFLTQEHNVLTPAKAQTWSVQSGVRCTDH